MDSYRDRLAVDRFIENHGFSALGKDQPKEHGAIVSSDMYNPRDLMFDSFDS